MSAIYDNWERLVAAVMKKQKLYQLIYAESMKTTLSSTLSHRSSFSSPLQNVMNYHDIGDTTVGEGIRPSGMKLHFVETLRKEKIAVPYRSVMDSGITTVVKRLRGSSFEEDTEAMESNCHANGDDHEPYFSYRSDEMIVIYEYQSQDDNVSTVLHGKRLGMYELDWAPRVRIAIAVAKAIANNTNSLRNANMNSQTNVVFSSLGLEKMTTTSSIVIPTAGYCPPEASDDHQPSASSDIYTFGVLLLELLTGAFSMNGTFDSRMQLVRSVSHKFLEVGTLIVFEFVPVKNRGELIEMWKMLLVAMRCVEENPKQRPDLCDVVKMMDDIKMCPS